MPHKFHPYPIVQVTRLLLFGIFFTALFTFFSDDLGGTHIFIILIVWATIGLLAMRAVVSAQFHTIILDEATITYLSGVLTRNRVILPYVKITEATFRQNLLQRIFNVGTLLVDSAGGATVAIYVEDIKSDELEKIVVEINKKVGKEDVS